MPTAIVTGAASGIGRATALQLAAKKYSLALAGRTQSTLEKVAEEILALGAPPPVIIPTDVSQFTAVQKLIRLAHEKLTRIDVLINNAGLAPALPTHEISPQQWHEILDTNLSSAFYATREVWPIMQSQTDPNGGVIINISSMAAKNPFPGLGAYAVAKIGVNMLTLATAREGEPHQIRVIAIAPAATHTPMFANLVGEKNVNPDQILKPQNVADAILSAIDGPLQYASGDTIYLHRPPA